VRIENEELTALAPCPIGTAPKSTSISQGLGIMPITPAPSTGPSRTCGDPSASTRSHRGSDRSQERPPTTRPSRQHSILQRSFESGGLIPLSPAVEAVDRVFMHNEGEWWAGGKRKLFRRHTVGGTRGRAASARLFSRETRVDRGACEHRGVNRPRSPLLLKALRRIERRCRHPAKRGSGYLASAPTPTW